MDNLHIRDIPYEMLLKVDQVCLDDIETAASLCAKRAERFVEGLNVLKDVTALYEKYYGDSYVNQNNGLVKQYNKLREEVINHKNNMSLVLIGVNSQHILIDKYVTNTGHIIDLTVSSISRTLLKNYFSQEEIHELCRKTNSFDMYYKHVLNNRSFNEFQKPTAYKNINI